jgi:hypothetical protein
MVHGPGASWTNVTCDVAELTVETDRNPIIQTDTKHSHILGAPTVQPVEFYWIFVTTEIGSLIFRAPSRCPILAF